MKTPIVMIVDIIASSLIHFFIKRDMDNKKQMPQMKARRDKNNSQRMGDFRVK